MSQKYTLSFYRAQKVPVLKPRPWWKIFGRDSIEMADRFDRHVLHDIFEDEAEIIIQASRLSWSGAEGRLVRRLIGDDAKFLQLEQGNPASQYVRIDSVKS